MKKISLALLICCGAPTGIHAQDTIGTSGVDIPAEFDTTGASAIKNRIKRDLNLNEDQYLAYVRGNERAAEIKRDLMARNPRAFGGVKITSYAPFRAEVLSTDPDSMDISAQDQARGFNKRRAAMSIQKSRGIANAIDNVLKSRGVDYEIDTDTETGQVNLRVSDPSVIPRGLAKQIKVDDLIITESDDFPVPTTNFFGGQEAVGAKIASSSGVTVILNSGYPGLTTAGHAGTGSISFNGDKLDLEPGTWRDEGGYDMQVRRENDNDLYYPMIDMRKSIGQYFPIEVMVEPSIGTYFCLHSGVWQELRCGYVYATNTSFTRNGRTTYFTTRFKGTPPSDTDISDDPYIIKTGDSGSAMIASVGPNGDIGGLYGLQHAGSTCRKKTSLSKGDYNECKRGYMMPVRQMSQIAPMRVHVCTNC